MPRYNVEHDGYWACFSSIVDDFVTPFMPLARYEEWRTNQYGVSKPPLKSNLSFAKAAEYKVFREMQDTWEWEGE